MSPRIILGVTADASLGLMEGFPTFLASQGWEVHVVSAPGPRSASATADPTYTTHTIQMVRDPRPIRDLRSLIAWVRLLRRVRPDIISVGTPKAGLRGALAGLLTRVPRRVYLLRGLRYETASGPRRQLLRIIERLTCKSSHAVLAVSASLRDLAIAEGLCPAHKISVVGPGSSNGVDLERFYVSDSDRSEAKQLRWGREGSIPVIGFIGRLSPDKGIDLLLQACEALLTQGHRFRLLVVGGSPEAIAEFKARAAIPLLMVEFHGSQSRIPEFLTLFDILCLPTKREGFPNVVLEAAAASVPTVATPATGIADAIVSGQTGLITTKRSTASLTSALAELLQDAEKRKSLGRAARIRAEEGFSNQAVWKRYSTFYENVVVKNKVDRNP